MQRRLSDDSALVNDAVYRLAPTLQPGGVHVAKEVLGEPVAAARRPARSACNALEVASALVSDRDAVLAAVRLSARSRNALLSHAADDGGIERGIRIGYPLTLQDYGAASAAPTAASSGHITKAPGSAGDT